MCSLLVPQEQHLWRCVPSRAAGVKAAQHHSGLWLLGWGCWHLPHPDPTSGPPLAVAYVLQLFNLGLERWFWLEASGMRRKAQLMSAGVALLTSCEQHYKEQPVASPLVLPRQQLL